MASLPIDDKDLDDAALWAVIDSTAAASYSTTTTTTTSTLRKPLTLKYTNNLQSPPQILNPSSSPSPPPPISHQKFSTTPPHYTTFKDSVRVPRDCRENSNGFHHPQKISRSSCISETAETSPDFQLVKNVKLAVKDLSPYSEYNSPQIEYAPSEDKDRFTHCLSGRFPTVSLFKDFQDSAMAILEKSDYTMISGNPFIKKSGWRKMAFFFNISFEIKDKSIEFDENRNVQRAEFVVRAYMQGGRFSDGWGTCERREKRFLKPNNDIPSTAETRAKNKACQDLLGIGQYRPGVYS